MCKPPRLSPPGLFIYPTPLRTSNLEVIEADSEQIIWQRLATHNQLIAPLRRRPMESLFGHSDYNLLRQVADGLAQYPPV